MLVHFESTRYIFGQVSEGCQRAMVQRRTNMARINTIFMTGNTSWHNNGGLLGLILTLASVLHDKKENLSSQAPYKSRVLAKLSALENAKLHIIGPENLCHLLATARRFIFRQSMLLRPSEVRGDPCRGLGPDRSPDYADDNIKVWYMPIWPDDQGEPSSPTGIDSGTRKRGYDEMSVDGDDNPGKDLGTHVAMNEEEKYNFLREVVSHMFESSWSIDQVSKTTLHKAKLPAKLWVKNAKGKLVKYEGPMPGDPGDIPDVEVYVREPWPGVKITNLPNTKPSKQSLCYIVMTHPRRGKFNPVEAIRLGVDKPDFKVLAAGQSVKGADGNTVTPEMVLGDALPGNGFAIVDIIDASYIESLLNRPEMKSDMFLDQLAAIYWFLGPGVVNDARVSAYIKSRPRLKHIISSGDTAPNALALESPSRLGIWMRMIDKKRFGSMHFNNVPDVDVLPEKALSARPGQRITLQPRLKYGEADADPFLDIKSIMERLPPEVTILAREATEAIDQPEFRGKVEEAEKDIPNRDTEIITLGTGSAVPSKYRNVSGTLVRVPGVGSYLFDCGENTLGQMRRCFGDKLPDVLRDLKLIWISHLHADHHLGTSRILRAWTEETARSAPNAKLEIASHHQMQSWLREYSCVEDIGYLSGLANGRVTFHVIEQTRVNDANLSIKLARAGPSETTSKGGRVILDSCFVNHCFGSLAVCLTFPSGLKVAYSGDCRPSENFARISRDATLLIHEATFGDEHEGEAIAKKHCTITEAMEVAKQMRARRVMLTHFSQRYPKVANIIDTASPEVKDQAILFAFDNMRVKLGEWREAQQYWPAITKLLAEDPEIEEGGV